MSHETGIGKLWAEIGRRNVGRVALVYAGVAWGIVHMSTVMAEAIEIPHWVNRFLVFLLVILAPVVIGFSWVYELTPEGFKRAAEVEKDTSITHRTAQRLNVVIIVLMVLLAGLYGADRFLAKPEQEQAATQAASNVSSTVQANLPAPQGTAVAVLPFVNLSSDKEQEYFSDGMTEEITAALAKIHGLKVVGRTSAFQFKGENKDLREIGRALGVTELIEGSVRKAGDRVRITAQLIKADDDTHLWADNYDRDLKDVFAVQEDVAKAIAAALQVPLGLQAGESLVANRTTNTDFYQDYLRAKALVRGRGAGTSLDEPIGLLEHSVAGDPSYAPAWALLSQAYALAPTYDAASTQGSVDDLRRIVDLDIPKAEAAARRAMALDVGGADGYIALAVAMESRGRFADAEDLYHQALKLDAYNPDGLHLYAYFLAIVGKEKEALAVRTRLQSIEPLVPIFNLNMANVLWAAGKTEAALSMITSLPSSGSRARTLARVYASMGRFTNAANAIENEAANIRPSGAAEVAVRLLRRAPQPPENQNLPDLGGLDYVYLYVGLPERAVGFLERQNEAGFKDAQAFLEFFHPAYAPVRKTQRFKELMLKSGRVEYWRARGWPDVCHPVGADDFACE